MPWRTNRGGGIIRRLEGMQPFNPSEVLTPESGVSFTSDECTIDGNEDIVLTSDITLSPARSLSANQKVTLAQVTDTGLVGASQSGDFEMENISNNGCLTFTAPSTGTYSAIRVEDLQLTDS